jgi:FkbM family methyltransferase
MRTTKEPRAAAWVRELSSPERPSGVMRIPVAYFRRALTAACVIMGFRNWSQVIRSTFLGRSSTKLASDITMDTRIGIRITAPNVAGAMWPVLEVYALHTYRLERFDLADSNVLDVGAHVGAFSIAVCAAYRGTTVSAFEPTPETFHYLDRNIQENGLAGRIVPFNEAISRYGGPVSLRIQGSADSTNRIQSAPSRDAISVPSITLAQALSRTNRRFDVCKLDCEGAEYDLLEATDADAWDGVRLILLEVHPVNGRSRQSLFSRLQGLGFRVVLHEEYAASEMAWLSR